MRKHLYLTMLLLAGTPALGTFQAQANPEPQVQGQAATTITGTVLDENNEPVIGASVVQKGVSGNAVATDAFGHFKLRVPLGAPLMVSYVGYKTIEIKAAQDLTVYLEPTSEMLNELVAIGYGSQKRANLTGAVATVDVARTMDSRPATDVAKALQGAVPGLTITSANGSLDGTPTINIRGVGTLSNSHTSSPLIVVDGVPVDDMSFLNPEDIADISVLKDAASSAIYGTRAAFGVILITTKEGSSKDRVSVKYVNNFGWNSATVLPEFASTVDNMKLALQNTNPGGDKEIFGMYYSDILPFAEAWAQQHGGEKYTGLVELKPFQSWDNVGDYYSAPGGPFPAGNPNAVGPMQSSHLISYADWDIRKTMFHAAPSSKHNISVEGQSGRTNYRLSFGYDAREGMIKYSPEKMHRYMANASVSTQIFKWWKAGARFSFSNREFEGPNEQANAYQYMWRWPGQYQNYGYINDAEGKPMYVRNPASIRMNSHTDKTVSTQTRMQAFTIFNPIKGLSVQADFTYSLRNMNSDSAAVPYSLWNTWSYVGSTGFFSVWNPYSQATSYAAQSNGRTTMWTANVFGTYDITFNDAHNLKVMLGWTAEQEEYRYFYARRNGLIDYNLPNINLTNSNQYTTNGTHTHRATTGFFGRINYDYKGIYLLELNGRYDGSSRFPANDQWAFFPSGSVGYRFSEENYFQPLKSWWSNGKLRASYGHIGNEAVGSNMFLSTVSPVSAANVSWLNGDQKIVEYGMPTLVSSSLTWERIVTTDVGLDLGFLDNSLNVAFDWYQRDTKDMLGPTSELPAVLGASAPYGNAGSLRTRGWELSLNWNHSFGDWDVYATASIGDARTKITKWNDASRTLYSFDPQSGNYTEGMNYGDILGFETDGYFTMDDFHFVPGAALTDDDGNPILNADGQPTYQRGTYVRNDGVVDQSFLQNGTFTYGPGDVKFKDLNGDGVINNGDPNMKDAEGKPVTVGSVNNHGDLKVIGNALPRYEYSFRIGGAWKGFDIDLFFQGIGKRNMWATGSTIIPMAQSGYGTFTNLVDNYNVIKFNEDATSPNYGQITEAVITEDFWYPRLYSGLQGRGNVGNVGLGSGNFYPQSRYLMNMAYLRFKNLTVGYTLPYEITKKALIQKARIYFSADNLCFLYNGAKKYQLDPEMTTGIGSNLQGYNDGYAGFGRTAPIPRTFSFGIQVTL